MSDLKWRKLNAYDIILDALTVWMAVNWKELLALALVGPTRQNPVLDPSSCTMPQQLTIYKCFLVLFLLTRDKKFVENWERHMKRCLRDEGLIQ